MSARRFSPPWCLTLRGSCRTRFPLDGRCDCGVDARRELAGCRLGELCGGDELGHGAPPIRCISTQSREREEDDDEEALDLRSGAVCAVRYYSC